MGDDYLSKTEQVGHTAIQDLVEKYWKDIWNYVFYLTKKHDAADDIAQETFVKALIALADYRGQSSVKRWLLKICHNQTANYRRSAFFRKMVPVPFVKSAAVSSSAESVFFHNLNIEDIFRKLLELPHKYAVTVHR